MGFLLVMNLFNHESPRRGETFVTRKITIGISKILNKKMDCLYLGNLDSKRDWGHAKDYVRGMYLILQNDKPDDFVLSTGVTTTIRDFILKSFKYVGIEISFKGKGENEIGFISKNKGEYDIEIGKVVIKVDPSYFRPTEVDILVGDSSKANKELNWQPNYDLNYLIKDMMDHDLNFFK